MVETLYYKSDIYNRIIFVYIIIDFLLTYLGINNFNCIEEANPIMAWLFELPFMLAIVIRIIVGAIIYSMCRFIQENATISYKNIIIFTLAVENYVLLLHVRWIVLYLS